LQSSHNVPNEPPHRAETVKGHRTLVSNSRVSIKDGHLLATIRTYAVYLLFGSQGAIACCITAVKFQDAIESAKLTRQVKRETLEEAPDGRSTHPLVKSRNTREQC
jgi:hypothetical protein